MVKLIGRYNINKANILKIDEPLHLVIGQRRNVTLQKPRNYLLRRISSKEHTYISSLFESREIACNGLIGYCFDYQGAQYVLVIDPATGTATISERPAENSMSPINNAA